MPRHDARAPSRQWICESCGFIYDPAEGDPDGGIPRRHRVRGHPGRLVLPGLRRPQGRLLALRGLSRGGRRSPAPTVRSRRARGVARAARGCSSSPSASSTLGAEIAAARLMAPFFGASTVIWANTIAVVLRGAVGRLLVRRAAGRPPPARCAALCALVLRRPRRCWRSCRSSRIRSCRSASRRSTRLGRRVRRLAVRRARAGRRAGAAARRGVAVGDPAEARGRRGLGRGRRAACTRSRRSARWSATFAAALVLIPLVGTQRTFLAFALALAVVAALGARPPLGCSCRWRSPRCWRSRRARSRPPSDGRVLLRGRDAVPVRARRAGRRRRAPARAQRGPGDPLAVAGRALC